MRASLDILVEVLPYFFARGHFAPQLETLEIVFSPICSRAHFPFLTDFQLLDQHIRSRPSLNRIIVSHDQILEKPNCLEPDREKIWTRVESEMRTHLPMCEESRMIEFIQSPWKDWKPTLF